MKDGKIHLHKLNGVKIAVSVAKMAIEDLEYVERVTGVSLDDDKPLSDIRRRSLQAAGKEDRKKSQSSSATPTAGILTETPKVPEPKGTDYDWFDFFLKSGVNPYQCERYAFNFNRDSMDESILPDITPTVLRTLGLKEGDILRVTKYLDSKYGRTSAKSKLRNVSFSGEEVVSPDEGGSGSTSPNGTNRGLFSGPGGALRNNTRKGRPAPAVQNDDVVDAETFKQRNSNEKKEKDRAEPTPLASVPLPEKKPVSGFDDDAWDLKPSKKPSSPKPSSSAPATVATAATAPSQPPLTGAQAELSLLAAPLQPTVVHGNGGPQAQQPQNPIPSQGPSQQFVPASNPSFFPHASQQQTGGQIQQPNNAPAPPPINNNNNHQGYQNQQPLQQNISQRQRPQAPQITQQGSLMLPPPPRPLSAPQNISQNNSFGPPPLLPQLTGAQNQPNFQTRIAPPGQSLNELDQLQLQQQYLQQQVYKQQTGFVSQNPAFGQYGNVISNQPTGYGQHFHSPSQQPEFQNSPPFLNGQQTSSPFADPTQLSQLGSFQPLPPQLTGYPYQSQGSFQTRQTGSVNSVLQPALQPQVTGANGYGSGNNIVPGRPGFGQPPPPMPPSILELPAAPLQPQKTGPAPPIRFGVGDTQKLVPQPTGKKANLSQASKCCANEANDKN